MQGAGDDDWAAEGRKRGPEAGLPNFIRGPSLRRRLKPHLGKEESIKHPGRITVLVHDLPGVGCSRCGPNRRLVRWSKLLYWTRPGTPTSTLAPPLPAHVAWVAATQRCE